MATSGAYYNTAFTFNHSFVDSADPTLFFTGTLANTDITVYKRTGSTTVSPGTLTTSVPAGSGGVYTITLTASEMQCDEVVLSFAASGMVKEAVSITTEPTPSDVLEVQKTAVSGVADFKATGFSTFNAASDTVTTDAASRTASQANVSALATSAEIAALNDFDPAADTVANVTTVGSVSGSVGSVVAAVTAGTVSDKTGYSITGTLTTLDALDTAQDSQHSTTQSAISGLNNISAADVYTQFTTGTNEDVFKADVSGLATASALTTVDTEVGQIKAKTDQLTFTVANQVDANALTGASDATASNQTTIINHLTDVKGAGWTSTDNLAEITEDVTGLNGDAMRGTDGASTTTPPTAAAIYSEFTSGSNENAFKADVSSLATSAEVSALNNLSSSDVAAAVWNAAYASYNTAGSFGKLMDIIRKSNLTIEGTVAGTGTPTTTEFHTNLTYVDDAFDEQILLFVSGALEGESRPINRNFQLNGRVVLDEAFTSPPTSGDEFVVLPEHIHSLASISDSILSRDVDNVEATLNEHTLGTIILCILESVRTGTTWTIRRTDGATTHVTKTLTLDSGADPVTGVD